MNKDINNMQIILETPRLYLREMNLNDFDSLYQVLGDSDIMKHYPYTFDEKRVKNWILKNIERYNTFSFGLWAVCLKETNEMIGDCGLSMQNINGIIRPEIGYHIRKISQRKGYGSEAADACINWTFMNTPFKKLFSYMKSTNIPSERTAKKCGMKLVDEYIDENNELTKVCMINKDEYIQLLKINKATLR